MLQRGRLRCANCCTLQSLGRAVKQRSMASMTRARRPSSASARGAMRSTACPPLGDSSTSSGGARHATAVPAATQGRPACKGQAPTESLQALDRRRAAQGRPSSLCRPGQAPGGCAAASGNCRPVAVEASVAVTLPSCSHCNLVDTCRDTLPNIFLLCRRPPAQQRRRRRPRAAQPSAAGGGAGSRAWPGWALP